FDLIAAKVGGLPAHFMRSNERQILLMNAPGNKHTLAVRILALWLASKGARVQIVDRHCTMDEIVNAIAADKTEMLLISMALSEQRAGVVEIAERVAELPLLVRPAIVVGGYAVKLGLVPPIPGAELLADISHLIVAERPVG
ncbi:cobalamin-dependent protein, partial [Bradyrhizobium sp.]|uniref:cobalamin-dependent protein n=1 Tax=Bradyrhizobium sp. TaxID=376 RepID=UPI003C315181